MTMSRRLLLLVAAALLVLAACGSDDGASVDAGSGGEGSAATTASSTPATSAAPDEPEHDMDDMDDAADMDHHADDTEHDHDTDDVAGPPLTADEHHPECLDPVTPEQQAAADQLIADVFAAKAAYATTAQAAALGYSLVAPPFDGAGTHWVNPDLFGDGRIVDPQAPESLVFDGSGNLEAAMFMVDELGDPTPMPGGCLTTWHSHDNLCMTAPFQDGGAVVWLSTLGGCPDGSSQLVPPDMLHVWVRDHPDGPFAPVET